MADQKQPQKTGIKSGSLSYEEGYTYVRAAEESNAVNFMNANGHILRVEGYDVGENEVGYNVTITIYAQGFEDKRKAEWGAYMLAKKLHSTIYKENKISFIYEGGYRVLIAWMIYKPRLV